LESRKIGAVQTAFEYTALNPSSAIFHSSANAVQPSMIVDIVADQEEDCELHDEVLCLARGRANLLPLNALAAPSAN